MSSTEVGKIHYTLDLDDTNFKAGTKSASEGAGNLAGSLTGAVAKGMLVAAAIEEVGKKAFEFGKQSLAAFNEQQTVQAQLGAVLKSTGQAAGVTADQANRLSEELGKQNALLPTTVLQGENMLLTFTNIGKDIFPATSKAVIDMATAMNGGLTPSAEQLREKAILVGKALQDPDAGLGALHRVGVNVDELKKKFTDSMPIQEKQKLIIQELGTEFGGSGAAAAKTFGGQIQALKNSFTEFKEKVGQFIVEGLQWLERELPKVEAFLKRLWAQISPVLIPALKWLWETIKQVTASFMEAWNTISPILMPALTALWNTISTQLIPALKHIWDVVSPVLVPALKIAAEIIGVVVVAAIWLIINVIKIVISWFSFWINVMADIYNAVFKAIKDIYNIIKGIPDFLKTALKDVENIIFNPFKAAFDKIKNAVNDVKGFLNKLNPFSHNSPSLVELVTDGTKEISNQYGKMFNGLQDMTMKVKPQLDGAVQLPFGNTSSNSQITNHIGSIQVKNGNDADTLIDGLTRSGQLLSLGMSG